MLINWQAPEHVYLVCGKTDLRKGIDGLAMVVAEKMMEKRSVIVAVSEGLRNEEGAYLTDSLQNRVEDEEEEAFKLVQCKYFMVLTPK